MKIIFIILIKQAIFSPIILFITRRYIERNYIAIDFYKDKPYAIFKDGAAIRYDLPMRLITLQMIIMLVGFIGFILL